MAAQQNVNQAAEVMTAVPLSAVLAALAVIVTIVIAIVAYAFRAGKKTQRIEATDRRNDALEQKVDGFYDDLEQSITEIRTTLESNNTIIHQRVDELLRDNSQTLEQLGALRNGVESLLEDRDQGEHAISEAASSLTDVRTDLKVLIEKVEQQGTIIAKLQASDLPVQVATLKANIAEISRRLEQMEQNCQRRHDSRDGI